MNSFIQFIKLEAYGTRGKQTIPSSWPHGAHILMVRQTVVTDKEEENVLRKDFLPDLSSDTRAFIADAVRHPGGSGAQV